MMYNGMEGACTLLDGGGRGEWYQSKDWKQGKGKKKLCE